MSTHTKFQDSDNEKHNFDDGSEIDEAVSNNEEDEEMCSSSESENENDIMKGMSMEELLKIRERIGTKKFTEKIVKRDIHSSSISNRSSTKRANKNRPIEVPIMRKLAPKKKYFVTKKHEADPVNKLSNRDPRFDDISGKLDITSWKKNYSFINDKRIKEMKSLKSSLRREKDISKSKLIKKEIQKMDNQKRELDKCENERVFKQKQRDNAIQALREGKAPKFISKKEVKSHLSETYIEKLKKENKVDKYYARKEKKQRNKEFKQFGKSGY